MIATYVQDHLTPLTFEQAAMAMKAALASEMVAAVRDDQLSLALAKCALETGRWQKIHCWNWGNIKAGDSYVGMYTAFGCGEELAEGSCWFEPDGTVKNRTKHTVTRPVAYDGPPWHPQTRFRAYANEFDGAFAYVDFVNSGHYAKAWQALLTGNATAYVHELKQAHYFTGPEGAYAAGVVSLQKEFVLRLRGIGTDPAPVEWSEVQNACRASLARLQHEFLARADWHEGERATDTIPSPPPSPDADQAPDTEPNT